MQRVLQRSTLLTRTLQQQRRHEGTYQRPSPPPPINRHRQYYRNQGLPVLKAIVIAITTQQLLYWGWLKLESLETKSLQDQDVEGVVNEIRDALSAKSGS